MVNGIAHGYHLEYHFDVFINSGLGITDNTKKLLISTVIDWAVGWLIVVLLNDILDSTNLLCHNLYHLQHLLHQYSLLHQNINNSIGMMH